MKKQQKLWTWVIQIIKHKYYTEKQIIKNRTTNCEKKTITEKNTEKHKYLLHNKLWEDTFLFDDVNTSFDASMSYVCILF